MPDHVSAETGVLLVGAGPMAKDYVDVLKAQGVGFHVVGRSRQRAAALAEQCGIDVTGGLLLAAGCRSLLLEKPAALTTAGIRRLAEVAGRARATVTVGFNRRYYSSVREARRIAREDGGISSAFFDFTELTHRIAQLEKAPAIKEHWFLANSLHVVDLVFHLIGAPREIESRVSGALPWHSRAAQFAGSGASSRDVVFSYHADWAAPGRWKVELFTPRHKLSLCPLESLDVQVLGSFDRQTLDLDDELDRLYKPGLYRQVQAWLAGDMTDACTLDSLAAMTGCYDVMAGYAE